MTLNRDKLASCVGLGFSSHRFKSSKIWTGFDIHCLIVRVRLAGINADENCPSYRHGNPPPTRYWVRVRCEMIEDKIITGVVVENSSPRWLSFTTPLTIVFVLVRVINCICADVGITGTVAREMLQWSSGAGFRAL